MRESWLVKNLHNLPRKDAYYRELPNDFDLKSSDYVDGVVLVAVYHFYWLVAALIIIPLAFLRAYRLDPKGNIREALYRCLFVSIIALCICCVLEVVALRYSATGLELNLNTRDHHFADTFLYNVRERVNQIKQSLSAPLPVKPEDRSSQQAVNELISSLIHKSDEMVMRLKEHSYSGQLVTPMTQEIWNTQWVYFISLMVYWCSGILAVGILALCKKPYTGAIVGVIWCGLGACILTCAALCSADACCDPEAVTEHFVHKSLETSSMDAEYQRFCKEWYAGALKLFDAYQEGFHAGETLLNAGLRQDYSLYRASITKKIRELYLKEMVDFRKLFLENNCQTPTLIRKTDGSEAMNSTCEQEVALKIKVYQTATLLLVGVFFIMFLMYIIYALRPDVQCPCWKPPPPPLIMPSSCPGPPPNPRNLRPKMVDDPGQEWYDYQFDEEEEEEEARKKGISVSKDVIKPPSILKPSKGSGLCRGTTECPGTSFCKGPSHCPGSSACPGPQLGEDYCPCKKITERSQVIYIKQTTLTNVPKPVVLKVDQDGHVRADLKLIPDLPAEVLCGRYLKYYKDRREKMNQMKK